MNDDNCCKQGSLSSLPVGKVSKAAIGRVPHIPQPAQQREQNEKVSGKKAVLASHAVEAQNPFHDISEGIADND
jgi:hypothetical protein